MNKDDVCIGALVKSITGHDKSTFYLVAGIEDGYAMLCDGKIRKLDNQKKKSLKHIKDFGIVSDIDISAVNDAAIRKEIKRLRALLPTTVLLIRHGQSDSNLRDTMTGQSDPQLTERGILQAEVTAEFVYGNFDVDAVYSSDLKRAKHTADALANKLKCAVKTSKLLREMNVGVWDDKPFDEIERDYPEEYSIFRNDIGNASCPGGESSADVAKRVFGKIKSIVSENVGNTVAVAIHGGPIRAMQAVIGYGSVQAMKDIPWVANAAVVKITYLNDDWKIEEVELDENAKRIATRLPDNI